MVDGASVHYLGDDAVIRILHDRVVALLTPRRILLGDALAEV
jgi:hypothetical protein